MTYDGKIWGVPCLTDARMFYCKGHIEDSGFSELPKTWHETKDMSKKVWRRSCIRYGYVFQGAQDEDGVVADAPERVRDVARRPERRRGGRGQDQVGGGSLAAAEHDH